MSNRTIKAIAWLGILGVILMLFCNCPIELDIEKKKCFFVLCIQLLIIWLVLTIVINKFGISIIEPIALFSAVHIAMFNITPILCLLTNEIDWFGKDVWSGCCKGTWISTLAYCLILFMYYRRSPKFKNYDIEARKPDYTRYNCLYFNYVVWFLAFSAHLYYIASSGKSVLYILLLGMGNHEAEMTEASSLAFLGVVAYAMLPSYLYILKYATSKIMKILLLYLMAATFIVRGFRFILIAIILAPIIFICLDKNKRPKIYQVISIFVILLLLTSILQLTRDSIRAGTGVDFNFFKDFSFDIIYDIILENFSIVKTYYGVVNSIPEKMGYTFGSQMILYTAIMLIPRALWPSKPQPVSPEVLSVSVSEYAAQAGTAYPYIGEYYHEFGIVGVIVFSLLAGKMLNWLRLKMYEQSIGAKVLYASVMPLIFQIMIRGYTPSNFYMILFVVLPVIISEKFFP